MKKVIALLLAGTMALAMVGCAAAPAAAPAETAAAVEETAEEVKEEAAEAAEELAEEVEEVKEEAEGAGEDVAEALEEAAEEVEEAVEEAAGDEVMSYAEYAAAELDSKVVVETYVQACQSWWDNKITVYSQDEDGAYFLYDMACSEEDSEKLVPGTKIRVTGYKSEWAGEVEIVDGEFEFIDGEFVAEPLDITDMLGTDELADHQNEFICVGDVTVEAAGQDEDGNDLAFLYNWDGSGQDDGNSDLYLNVSKDGETYSFVVRRYLTGKGSDVYEAVKNLQIGDTVSMEGFLYWYEGPQPHITKIEVK